MTAMDHRSNEPPSSRRIPAEERSLYGDATVKTGLPLSPTSHDAAVDPDAAMASPSSAGNGSKSDSQVLTEQRTVISKRPPLTDVRFDQAYTPFELGQTLVGKQLAHFQLEQFL